jgi:hypothetical protein
MIRKNVGGLDKGVRLVFGPLLLFSGLFLFGGLRGEGSGLVIALVGLLGLATGASAYCPLYVPFGISTAKAKKPA